MYQNFEHRWVFGRGVEIQFPNGGAPVAIGTRPFFAPEGTACLSDPDTGQLLFYTDGDKVWDPSDTQIFNSIGGSANAYQGTVIIPPTPCGTIKNYHIFGTWEGDTSPGIKDMMHSSYSLSGGVLSQVTPPTPMLNATASERISAISKPDCKGYWIVTQEINSRKVHLVSLDSDTPNFHSTQVVTSGLGGSWEEGEMEFSPDGKFLAWTDSLSKTVVVTEFNISTGQITLKHTITGVDGPIGLEFSPNSQFLYFSGNSGGVHGLHQHNLFSPAGALTASAPFVVSSNFIDYNSMRLGPDGIIYVVGSGRNTLSAITNPDSSNPANGFQQDALTLPDLSHHGLPNFPRLLDRCGDGCGCDTAINTINEELSEELSQSTSRLKNCENRRPRKPTCRDIRVPNIKPHIEVHWGNSNCDDIESTDTERLLITVCNTYNNISFNDVRLSKNVIMDSAGNSVQTLPDGDPSIRSIPRGPICFGDIDSCSCVTREIVVTSKGSAAGIYKFLLENLCFDVIFHYDVNACFQIEVCGD